ncbi:MAG: InlB B-repeat-containing protein, partial [Clostridia bacterium]|nr:InlB B-repeat-containing protein [Clostridia bacterium]
MKKFSKFSMFAIFVAVIFALGGGFLLTSSQAPNITLSHSQTVSEISQLKVESEVCAPEDGGVVLNLGSAEEEVSAAAPEEEVGTTWYINVYMYARAYNGNTYSPNQIGRIGLSNTSVGNAGPGGSTNLNYQYDSTYSTKVYLYMAGSTSVTFDGLSFDRPSSYSSMDFKTVNRASDGQGGYYYYYVFNIYTDAGGTYNAYVCFQYKQQHTVTLNQQSGSGGTSTLYVYNGNKITTTITPPTRTDYVFNGYYTSTNGGGTKYINADGTPASTCGAITSNTELYAYWTPGPRTISFNSNGGSSVEDMIVDYGAEYPLPTAPTRTGYVFEGWAEVPSAPVPFWVSGTKTCTGNKTWYAVWTANTYTINFDQQNGSGGSASVVATYGSAMPAITLPTRTGHAFNGYFTETNGGGTKYYNADGSSARNYDQTAGDTLYASWTANTYTVTINTSGYGTVSRTSVTSVDYGTSVSTNSNVLSIGSTTVTATPTAADGYTTKFSSWSNAPTTITGAVTITANFTRTGITYYVKYNANGGTGTAMANSTHTYGTAKNLTANTYKKTGYTFTGWAKSSTATTYEFTDKHSVSTLTTQSGETVNLYAVWSANKYYVVFNANGGTGTMGEQEFTYDDTAKALTANTFTKKGYTFQGWATTSGSDTVAYADKKAVRNLTPEPGGKFNLYAVWKANSYTVTFDQQSGSGGTTSIGVTYDSAMPSITLPTKTGYTFNGYFTATGGSGTKYYNADGSSAR